MMRCKQSVILIVVVGAFALAPLADARPLYFGISANSRNAGSSAQDLAAETGAHRLREDIEWAEVEPKDDEWDWSKFDDVYETAAERGLSILPIPNTSPCWAVPAETKGELCGATLPASDADYAEFVGKVAERYGPGGDFWESHPELNGSLALRHIEIWNEPYFGAAGPEDVDAKRYADLYKAAVIAGRAANASTRYLVESTIDARTGPKSSDYIDWPASLISAEPAIGSYIDGIAIHPYPGSHDINYEPENGTDEAFANTSIGYLEWKALGINKPIWITEVGYSSCADEATHCVPGATQAAREEKKAEWLDELLAELGKDKYGYVHSVYLYNLEQWTPSTEPDAAKSNWYGLAYGPNNEHLPAWNSFATAVEEFDGVPEPNTTITGQTGKGQNRTFTFAVNDSTAVTECKGEGAWSPCASPKSVSGVHSFSVRGINAEAVESSPASVSW
jgi:hypothetical protein